jgi:hypothetical protein
MIYWNLPNTAKAVLRGKFIAMNAYIKRTEKQEQANFKTSRKKEIIKIRAKINELETTTTKNIQRINETKSSFFENINKIDRPLANMTKMRREKTQISKIRNVKREITTNTMVVQEIIRDYFETYILIYLKILKKWTDF